MSILNTITTNIEFSAEMTIKIGNSAMNIINALGNAGRNTFTAEDIAYVINRSVKAERNKVTPTQVARAIQAEVKHNDRNEVRRGFKKITDIGLGFYQYGR